MALKKAKNRKRIWILSKNSLIKLLFYQFLMELRFLQKKKPDYEKPEK